MPQSDGKNSLKRMEFEFKGKAYQFNLNPEEYTQDEPSRSTVTQTKGGAWIDDFGGGLVTIFIKGTTGMRNGFEKFKELRKLIQDYKDNVRPGETVKDELIFHNFTDEMSWVVHLDPSGFKLFRSKSSPLLYMYEIRLVCLRPAQLPAYKTEKANLITGANGGNLKLAVASLEKDLALSEGVVTSVFSSYVGGLQVLNDGQIQVNEKDRTEGPVMFMLASSNNDLTKIEDKMTPNISTLSMNTLQRLKSGTEPTTYNDVDRETFLYKVLYEVPELSIDYDVDIIMKATLLEVYSIYKEYTTNQKNLPKRISREDIRSIVRNIRWITGHLGSYEEPRLYDVILGFRRIEMNLRQIERTENLFDIDVAENLKTYREGVDNPW